MNDWINGVTLYVAGMMLVIIGATIFATWEPKKKNDDKSTKPSKKEKSSRKKK